MCNFYQCFMKSCAIFSSSGPLAVDWCEWSWKNHTVQICGVDERFKRFSSQGLCNFLKGNLLKKKKKGEGVVVSCLTSQKLDLAGWSLVLAVL